MEINSVSVYKVNSNDFGLFKRACFKGKLIPFNTSTENVIKKTLNTDVFQSTEDRINWLNWAGKKAKVLSKKGSNRSEVNQFFDFVQNSFNEKENRLFLGELFEKSPEEAGKYTSTLKRVLLQFQSYGVPRKKCDEIKDSIDFIEGISSYKIEDDLFSKKFQ